jgi:hypothetical protein
VSQSRFRLLLPHQKTESDEPIGSEFRNLLLGTSKTYTVSLPHGRRHLAWCGASHGWLVASDELSNLVLYNPFTFATIPLPPITDLGVTAVYQDDGTILGYHHTKSHDLLSRPPHKLGCQFYEKVALSCDPSRAGGDCVAMAIYRCNQVSFARAGESSWRLATTTPCQTDKDWYADCVHHTGKFYAVTRGGAVHTWYPDEGPTQEPKEHIVIIPADGMYNRVLTRFLVSTPWGGLLQIRVLGHSTRGRTKIEVLEINVEKHMLVQLSPATAFQEHAVFVGLNESACLDASQFPELRPNCVYFTLRLEKPNDRGCSHKT